MNAKISDRFKIETKEFLCSNISPLEESFAFGLFFNSSEKRSLEYAKSLKDKAIKYSILVDFKENERELKKENLLSNQDILASKSNKFEILPIDDIFDYQNNLNIIVNAIPKNLFKLGAKFFIDITGAPLIYSVALLRYFKLYFPSPTLYLLNVSGDYDNPNNKEEDPQFSEGMRENIFIPGYYGGINHSKLKLYVFLLGFEGERSLNILKTDDPDYIKIIIPAVGYKEGYPHKTIDYNTDFLKEVGFTDEELDIKGGILSDKIIQIDIGKPEEVGNKILSLYDTYKNIADIRLVPLCPKPHAIGAGLAAIIEDSISIMYQTPKKYAMKNYLAGEKMWLYIIQ